MCARPLCTIICIDKHKALENEILHPWTCPWSLVLAVLRTSTTAPGSRQDRGTRTAAPAVVPVAARGVLRTITHAAPEIGERAARWRHFRFGGSFRQSKGGPLDAAIPDTAGRFY